ncbi:MAG: hypothetical protein FRX49_08830 [Trebouxia sp. A1-2]|nr:MAG: hypothetical protein FRX49_08830 [Trebouxia sp. A1-2]
MIVPRRQQRIHGGASGGGKKHPVLTKDMWPFPSQRSAGPLVDKAEFAKAGISAEATQAILDQYKTYLNWDIETKLRPALQSWLQELGAEQLSQQLRKVRRLLACKPQECNEVYLWLSSKGINAERVQQRAPVVMTRDIKAVQATFEALQQATALSDAQMCTLLHKHSAALAYGPERVLRTLQAVSTMLGVPMTSESFSKGIIVEAPNSMTTSGLLSYVASCSKARFSKRFSSPASNPSMVFDSAFIDHWKQRWEFLRQHMKLSVEVIAAHQDLLLTSLPDRLAPRWQLLSRLANEQAAFKAEDHLTALANLSDEDFARAFRADGQPLQGSHSHLCTSEAPYSPMLSRTPVTDQLRLQLAEKQAAIRNVCGMMVADLDVQVLTVVSFDAFAAYLCLQKQV